MNLKNPILFMLVGVFCILSILDIITSYFIIPGESNLIYLLTGNIFFMIAFKIGLMVIAVWIYSTNIYPSQFSYYSLMIIFLLANLLMIIAVVGNIVGILNPVYIESASQLTTQQKVKGYSTFVGLIYLFPLLLSLLSFKLYQWSLKYILIK